MRAGVYYTNAPEEYDGMGTITLKVTNLYLKRGMNSDRPFRIVDILQQGARNDWQMERYRSGLYLCLSVEEAHTTFAGEFEERA